MSRFMVTASLSAVFWRRLLQQLLPSAQESGSNKVRTKHGILAMARAGTASPPLTINHRCRLQYTLSRQEKLRRCRKAAQEFTELLDTVVFYGAYGHGGAILFSCDRALYGTVEELRARLLDSVQEIGQQRICGFMDPAGGRKRPYGHQPVDTNGRGLSTQESRIKITITHGGRLSITIVSPSIRALAGCWRQVMQRLGTLPAPVQQQNWFRSSRQAAVGRNARR